MCGILRSRVLRISCDLIKDVSPYWGEQNLTAVELSEGTNTKCVAMDVYATLFMLVGRNIINSSTRRGDKWSCLTRWTLYHTRTAILLSTVSHEPSDIILTFPLPINVWRHWRHSRSQISHEPSDVLLTCTWAVGHSLNMYVGLYGPEWLYVLGITPRGDLPLWTPRVRATDLGQGPTLRRGVRAAPHEDIIINQYNIPPPPFWLWFCISC